MSKATLTTCYETFSHADGRVAVEKLWYFIPAPMWGHGRFLGLVSSTTEAQAMATAKRLAARTGHEVRRVA